jgi:hypothetical protein
MRVLVLNTTVKSRYKGRPNETQIRVAVGIYKLIDRWDACLSVRGAYF